MPFPKISIITPCLDRAQFIREAIQSVLDQNYPEMEHLVMDAVSTDGTLDILKEYRHLRVVSEPDNGMYDAINKRIRLSRGEIIGLLNTDDLYAPGCFEAVVEAFRRNPDTLAVVGGIATFEDRDDRRMFVNHFTAIEPDELLFRVIQGHPVTNAWFFRRTLFDRAGLFDTGFRYAADRYFLIGIVLDHGVRPVPVRQELYYYRRHSSSVTMTTLDSRSPEYGLLRMKALREDIAGLEGFLDRPVLTDEARRRLRREHGERCYRLAATALYHRQWSQGWNAALRGWRRNIWWPWISLQMTFARIQWGMSRHD